MEEVKVAFLVSEKKDRGEFPIPLLSPQDTLPSIIETKLFLLFLSSSLRMRGLLFLRGSSGDGGRKSILGPRRRRGAAVAPKTLPKKLFGVRPY